MLLTELTKEIYNAYPKVAKEIESYLDVFTKNKLQQGVSYDNN